MRAVVEKLAPVPRTPSRLELQLKEAEIVPSSPSVAVPLKATESPTLKVEPFAGAVIVTVGAVLGTGLTVMEIAAVPESPPESVTLAVMVWVPIDRALVETLAPLPRTPSRFELQAMEAERIPSSESVAVPLKVILMPTIDVDPLAGAVMFTVGAVFETLPKGEVLGVGVP